MLAKNADWYKYGWSLDIKNHSWVEQTEEQVAFIIERLALTGKERILDLACGFGRHSLAFAKRGFPVVGVDLTKAYIDDAASSASGGTLPAIFLHADIRDLSFDREFDVVLNLADGAIGYLETEEENLKIFDVVSRALKSGGKHFMDLCNAAHAETYFPKTNWEIGEKAVTLSVFDWNAQTRRMLYGECSILYGFPAEKPNIPARDPIRLYSIEELSCLLKQRNMSVINTFSDYQGRPASNKAMQLLVYSVKD